MTLLRKLWNDEAGFVISTELVLVATILVMFMLVGMKKISSQVLAEMSDVANSIGYLNQTYSFTGAQVISLGPGGGVLASIAGTGQLPDSQDSSAADWVSIDNNVVPTTEVP